MKVLILLVFPCLLLGATESVLSERGELIYEEDFSKKLSSFWKSSKGNWQVTEGRLIGQEPEGHNHAVHLSYIPEIKGDVIIELDMFIQTYDAQAGIMFHPGKGSKLKGHLGRATLTGKFFTIRKDKSKAVKKEKFNKAPTKKWFHLTLKIVGDIVTAHLDGKEYKITHEDFGKAYKKKLILLAEKTVEYKNLKIYKVIAK
ncbi:MAG: hypothetical protein NE330_07255 [Lentisphaeraceae bacterium]|nr:hypothetical protein [Lentisphaeraceae bacterium]